MFGYFLDNFSFKALETPLIIKSTQEPPLLSNNPFIIVNCSKSSVLDGMKANEYLSVFSIVISLS